MVVTGKPPCLVTIGYNHSSNSVLQIFISRLSINSNAVVSFRVHCRCENFWLIGIEGSNWCHLPNSHFAYSHFAYSHFTYLLLLGAISPTPILPTYYCSVPFRLLPFAYLLLLGAISPTPICLLITARCHFAYSHFAYSSKM